MPKFVSLLFFAILAVVSSTLTWAADSHTYGTFALFEMDNQWRNLPAEERQKAGKEAQALLESNKGHCG